MKYLLSYTFVELQGWIGWQERSCRNENGEDKDSVFPLFKILFHPGLDKVLEVKWDNPAQAENFF